MNNEKMISEIVDYLRGRFRSFGGGSYNPNNPVSIALANSRPQFAAGVDIDEVVRVVLEKESEFSKKKPARKKTKSL